jgi:hypothetical protein
MTPNQIKHLYGDILLGWCNTVVESDIVCPKCEGEVLVKISDRKVSESCQNCDYHQEL